MRYGLHFIYAGLFFLAASLRFYDLGEPSKPVFDEIYFPKFAYAYIENRSFFHSHPPLAKYVFAVGIYTYHALPWVDAQNLGAKPFEQVDPLAYRWVNAILGLAFCMLVSLLCWNLSRSHLFTIICTLFVSIDGALVVASRFGLSNVHILFWGFLALFFFSRAVSSHLKSRYLWFTSTCIGCVICIKWNGLGYWLILVALLFGFYLLRALNIQHVENEADGNTTWFNPVASLPDLDGITIAKFVIAIFVVPVVVYTVLWMPDRSLNTKESFVEIHSQNWRYHKSKVAGDSHPYCSRWYSWPLMHRPISYEFSKDTRVGKDGKTIYFKSIHSFGNPVLYWLSSVAIAVVIVLFLYYSVRALMIRSVPSFFSVLAFTSTGYLATWLPWAFVSRCTFLYHYQTASVFSFMALAFCLYVLARRCGRFGKAAVSLLVAAVVVSFVYFLPFTLGIELERATFYDRMWFRSWI